ncbi:MAG TPA: pseudouridine-5'-phosphate glycosidase [Pyrinomonadaceae bacterium]|nr:pseudouridine-5'-phosphate glycosidase [Pyrinomonadaceae bacterium]
MLNPEVFSLSREVEGALADGRAVVALESTVIAHGLPRPQNLDTALRLEQLVREAGAVPATIAVIAGRVRVGLDRAALEHVATRQPIHKLSTRDLPVAIARKLDGATTVATTAFLAARAGISVFATGGIGGVHRGPLPDVSADLPELARTHLAAVVCSGAKSVLDLAATREWLETHGVTVVGYGCDEMPAFYTRASGLPVDVRADTPEEVAALARARRALGLAGALLVAVPVPVEDEVPKAIVEDSLTSALAEAEREGVAGRDLTPFLLRRLAERSRGATLRANVALLQQNTRVAAEIAVALAS